MLRFVQVDIGRSGILACARCGRSGDAAANPVSEIAHAMQREHGRWSGGAGPNVTLTGFEPFAHPELPAILAEARRAGFARIRLVTDGGALAIGGNAEGIFSAGVRHVEVVLLGDAGTHDSLTARPGLFGAASAGLTAFRNTAEKYGVDVFCSAVIPVCAHNESSLPDAVAASAALGVDAVTIDVAGHAPEPTQLDTALDTATVNGLAAGVYGSDVTAPFAHLGWGRIAL